VGWIIGLLLLIIALLIVAVVFLFTLSERQIPALADLLVILTKNRRDSE